MPLSKPPPPNRAHDSGPLLFILPGPKNIANLPPGILLISTYAKMPSKQVGRYTIFAPRPFFARGSTAELRAGRQRVAVAAAEGRAAVARKDFFSFVRSSPLPLAIVFFFSLCRRDWGGGCRDTVGSTYTPIKTARRRVACDRRRWSLSNVDKWSARIGVQHETHTGGCGGKREEASRRGAGTDRKTSVPTYIIAIIY